MFGDLDGWLRLRLRALHLRQWKRGSTMFAALQRLGASRSDALEVASNARCWWKNSRMQLNRTLPLAYFERLGVPRLAQPQPIEPPDADPPVRWCGRARRSLPSPPIPMRERGRFIWSARCIPSAFPCTYVGRFPKAQIGRIGLIVQPGKADSALNRLLAKFPVIANATQPSLARVRRAMPSRILSLRIALRCASRGAGVRRACARHA
jgi:hypothetical protein